MKGQTAALVLIGLTSVTQASDLIRMYRELHNSASASNGTSICSDKPLEEQETCLAVASCFSPPNVEDSSLKVICKAIGRLELHQSHESGLDVVRSRPATASVWGYSLLCVTVISFMSIMGVSVLPFMSKGFYSSMLTTLIGLAVGSLSGSAVFHLIPSAFKLSEVSFYEHHGYLTISLTVWGGLYLFFIIERGLKMVMMYRSKQMQGHDHSVIRLQHTNTETQLLKGVQSQDSSVQESREDDATSKPLDTEANKKNEGENSYNDLILACGGRNMNDLYTNSEQAIKASFGHMERPAPDNRPTVDQVRTLSSKEPKDTPIATVAWMIIFGDGVHNFIDGLSIGAAFSESILTGISVSLAVLCEEFPHELGDFAVLLNSGMTIKQAMMYNFLSACTCYIGLVIGIVLGEINFANQYIFGLAGGMFLYIALVDMIPELNETTDKLAKTSPVKAVLTFMLQNIGILVGIFSLYFLAKHQDEIQIGE